MIEFVPPGNEEVLNVQFPELSVQVPSTVEPFLKVTVPVAADGDTVAVKVTEFPRFEEIGFAEIEVAEL